MALFLLPIVLLIRVCRIDGSCVFPSSEWDGTWFDSRTESNIKLTSSTTEVTSGWSVTAYASSVTSWTCKVSDSSNRLLLFAGDQKIDLFGAPQNSYLCVKWTKITDYSYYYYLMAKQEVNAGNERVFIEDGSITMGTTDKYCASVNGPDVGEYNVIVKSGYESDVKQYCPMPLMGTFWYSYTDGSTAKCGQNSEMDVCVDRMTSTFNYQNCSENVAYTKEGSLYCVNHLTSGDTYFASLLNPGTVDNSNYYRFVCMVLTSTTSDVKVSISDGSCQKGQTSTTVPSGGGKAVLNPVILCRPCDPDPCYNGGTCTFSGVNHVCACVTGYSGTNCTVSDPCTISAPCQNGGTCSNPSNGTYVCACVNGYTGTDCEHEIPCTLNNPCENGGTCQASGLTYTCSCAAGYNGTNCTWIDSCILSSPCQNGATCSNPSSGAYVCACAAGYSGTDCEHVLPCFFDNYCENSGTCSTFGFNYSCACATGYTGINCTWSDPCILTNPCKNGATCNNPSSGVYNCSCVSGYYSGDCQDSDPCILQAPCNNGATCSNPSSGVYACACMYGFSGADCENELPCMLSNPCENGGTCQPSGLNYNCVCVNGYSGLNCTYADLCTISSPCRNGGSCNNSASGVYSCSCSDGYYGRNCENIRACTFPSTVWDGTWFDSRMNDAITLNYASAQISGWADGTPVSNVTSWTCILEDTNTNLFVFKGDNNITISGVVSSLFICMQWTMVTNVSYHYYLQTDQSTDLNKRRIYIEDASVNIGNVSTYCSPQSPPLDEEFHVILREGQETSAKQMCAPPLFGRFEYSYTYNNVTYCNGNQSSLDVCTDRTTVVFNYTWCSTRIAFTDEGQLFCLMYVQSGSVYFLSAFNPGSVGQTDFYRFSCFTLSSSGTNVITSIRPGSCEEGQSPSKVPTFGGGATLTPYSTCPIATGYPTPIPPKVAAASMAGFIGAAVAILLGVFLLMGSVCVYRKIKSRKEYYRDSLESELPAPKGHTVAHIIFLGKRHIKVGPRKTRNTKAAIIKNDAIRQWMSTTEVDLPEVTSGVHPFPYPSSGSRNLKAMKYHKTTTSSASSTSTL